MNSKLFVALALVLSITVDAAVDGKGKFAKILLNFLIIRNPITVPKWSVSDGNVTCLIVQMDIAVNFTYQAMGKWPVTV